MRKRIAAVDMDGNPLGMAWYKYLIYFALFMGSITNVVYGISYLTGDVYLVVSNGQVTAQTVYFVYGKTLQVIDVLFGLFSIGHAVLLLVERSKLAKFKPVALPLVYISYSLAAGVPFIYASSVAIITLQPISGQAIGTFVTNLLLLLANIKYFKKRAHLFVDRTANNLATFDQSDLDMRINLSNNDDKIPKRFGSQFASLRDMAYDKSGDVPLRTDYSEELAQINSTPALSNVEAKKGNDIQNVEHPEKYSFCRNCGEKLVDGSLFCHKCGTKINRKIQVAVKKVPIAVDRTVSGGSADMKAPDAQLDQLRFVQEQMRIEQARKEYESRIAEDLARKKKRRKKTVTIVVLLVIVPLLVCGVIFFGVPYFSYQTARNALANGEYDSAYQTFLDLDGFMDSDEMATETLYQKACNYLKMTRFQQAITIFEEISYYKNSEKKITECMYGYIYAHKNNEDKTTYNYLLTLKSQNEKEASTIYSDLYEWRAIGVINTDANFEIQHESSVSKYCDYLHCSFVITGGTPGEKIDLTHTVIYPNGEVRESDWHWYDECDHSTIGAEWENGLYDDPQYGATGTLTIKIYNLQTNELLGTVSTRITD